MQTDVLIIGCGIAGAAAALRLAADRQRTITVVTSADEALESNSRYAQGGIVGRGPDDSPALLVQDVLAAGAGLSYPPAVTLLAERGPALIEELLVGESGLPFDRDPAGQPAFGLEAAHSTRRILHVADGTGQAIMRAMLARMAAQPNITLLTRRTVVELITFPHHSRDLLDVYRPLACHGAYVFDQAARQVEPILAGQTILATGGLGQIFLNTTNPPGSRGDGLAMAYRAGARIINAEFVQFHPTALHAATATKFLISEAVRGEGGVLLTPDGEPFMERYAPEWKDLAPRDVVARAIFNEMLEHGYPYVLLDIATRRPADYLRQRFPRIAAHCRQQNIDITQQPIPVIPAAHYFCGGVLVDLAGRTTIPGLYAVGEVSCTGVHGANRLASTSLLEGLVWGCQAADDIRRLDTVHPLVESAVPAWNDRNLVYEADPNLIQGDMQRIRSLMWHYVGLVRSEYRLNRAIRDLRQLWLEIEEFYRKTYLSDGLLGLRNSAQAALIVAYAAQRNRRSLGCHYREDGGKLQDAGPAPEQAVKLSGGI
ncbi:MAG TPA: L-aspartate oxidase [Anaerolineales bacterium]|nr:L-aspartate oxidase [Anaerolineales bacterium]